MTSDTPVERTFISKVFITVAIVLLTVLLLLLVYFTFDVLLLVFSAVLLAILLRGLADMLGRWVPLSDGIRVMIVSAFLLAVLAGAIVGLAPSIADQGQHLREELPRSFDAARQYIMQFGWGRAIIEQLPDLNSIWDNIASSGMLSRVGGVFTSTIGAVGNVVIVILLGIYFSIEPLYYARGFTKLFPVAKRERVWEVLGGINEMLRWWLVGKAGSMLFIGVLTWIALSILGVPLALTLGLIAGLFSFIPNFGPILAAIPAVLIAFIESPMMAVYVIAIYVGVQIVEGNIVTPIIERETVELPPGLTVVFQLALSVLVGGLGLVLATPLLAMIMVIIQMVYVEDVLGDRETDVEEKIGEEGIEREGRELGEEE